MSGRGKFITVEGVEGVGKSTNIEVIKKLIEEAGHPVMTTREPGGTSIGERIREILLDRSAEKMSAMTELLLMFAARVQHVREVIEPALDRGVWVISDRFTDSSYAYQGGGRCLGNEPVETLEKHMLKNFAPDLTILLDIDIDTGLERALDQSEADRFESEQREFFERVRSTFLARAKADPRHRIVDASRPLAEVQAEIRAVIEELLTA